MKQILLIFLLACTFFTHAQLIEAYKEELEYQKENTFGINLNTQGGALGGINYRHSVKQEDGNWYTFFAELANIKHNKEATFQAPSTGNPFTYGKMNYLFVLRTQLSQEKRLFWKGKEDGVRLTWVYSAGPTLGFVKPYYIEYDYTIYEYDSLNNIDLSKTVFDERIEPYDPSLNKHANPGRILGSGGFFRGFGAFKTHVGISAKTALNFEFGIFDRAASGIETGIMMDYFFKEIVLFESPAEPNKFFSSIYLTFYFGSRKK